MAKAVLISIKPEWCELIISGQKTIEFRKSYPKDLPCKVIIYCSKAGKKLYLPDGKLLNGKVIGEFQCNDVFGDVQKTAGSAFSQEFFEKHGCVVPGALQVYSRGKSVYGWNIDDLEIYEDPKELSEYGVERAPQSWQYIEAEGL